MKLQADHLIDLRTKANDFLEKIEIDELDSIKINISDEEKSISNINLWKYPKLMHGIYDLWFTSETPFNDTTKKEFLKALKFGYSSSFWLEKHKEEIKRTNFTQEIINQLSTFQDLENIQDQVDINPWMIIKKGNYETFLAVDLFTNEPFINKLKCISSNRKIQYVIDSVELWKDKSTNETSFKTLYSRLFWGIVFTSQDKDVNRLLKTIKINDFDLDTTILYQNKEDTLQNLLLKSGKINFLNKVQINSKFNVDVSDIIIHPIKKRHLITQKQNFAKVFFKNFVSFNDTTFSKIFNKIISTEKESSYGEIKIKCYFPFSLSCFNSNGDFIKKEKFTQLDFINSSISSDSEHSLSSLKKLMSIADMKNPHFFHQNFDAFKNLFRYFFQAANRSVLMYEKDGLITKIISNCTQEQKIDLINDITQNFKSYFGYNYEVHNKKDNNLILNIHFITIDFLTHLIEEINPKHLKEKINFDFLNYLNQFTKQSQYEQIKNTIDRVNLLVDLQKEIKLKNNETKINKI